MRKRLNRSISLGVVAGVAAAFAVVGMGSVGAAVVPTGDSTSAKQYEEKVTICHRTGSKKKPFHTIRVSQNALKAHLKHGDARGPCPTAVFTMCHKTKSGKQQSFKVKGARKAERQLKKGAKLGKCKASSQKGKGKAKDKQKSKEKGKGKGKGKGK
jgi:hypothetical protein